jgi:hypothetical protein
LRLGWLWYTYDQKNTSIILILRSHWAFTVVIVMPGALQSALDFLTTTCKFIVVLHAPSFTDTLSFPSCSVYLRDYSWSDTQTCMLPHKGDSLHNGGALLGSFGGTSLFPCTRSALTKIGITPPVSSAKVYLLVSIYPCPPLYRKRKLTRCPTTSSILPIAPEWLVILKNTLPSESNTSSKKVARR